MSVIALLQARDEERFLPGWLANVAPCVDGIVALDDGSTDRTAEILADHPKVIELRQNPAGEAWDERANQVELATSSSGSTFTASPSPVNGSPTGRNTNWWAAS